jgi:cell wall-associated NlpC family hydrolase
MDEQESRRLAVEEAKTWIGTPYRLSSHKKGVGVDCVQFIAEVYKAIGLLPEMTEVPWFTQDWFMHTTDERYLKRVLEHARLMAETRAYRAIKAFPGDTVLTKAVRSKVYNHAGIVVAWPTIIHAIHPAVETINASTHQMWTCQPIAIANPWQKETNDRQNVK